MQNKIHKLNYASNRRCRSRKTIYIFETIDIMVQIGKSTELVHFLSVERPETSVLIGCKFFDRNMG